jgi:hypothetical protein
MPRDYFRQLFDERVKAREAKITGETMSKFKLVPFDNAATLMHVADIKVSSDIVSNVPLATNNRELLYAAVGTPVELSRSPSGRLEVTGLSKRGFNQVYCYTMDMPVITADCSDSTSAIVPGVVTFVTALGFSRRGTTLGELATVTSGGFGETPFNAIVLLDADGNILNVIA